MVIINLKPSAELAYIVGAILADGSIRKKDAYLFFAVKDDEFMNRVKNALDSIAEGNQFEVHRRTYKRSYDLFPRATMVN